MKAFSLKTIINKHTFNNLMLGVLFLYCCSLIINIAAHPEQYQNDFRVYNYAAKASEIGLDPYSNKTFSEEVPQPTHRYVYSPLTLPFFKLFSFFDYKIAYNLFLAFKCLVLVGLIYFWTKILGTHKDLFFYVFCLLAFNSTLYIDLLVGNITIIEQLFLWLAFYAFIRQKTIWFCVFIVLGAMFKFTPLLFLFLLLFSKTKNKYAYIGFSFLVFFAIHFFSYLNNPIQFERFLSNVAYLDDMDERGRAMPSTYPLVRHSTEYLLKFFGMTGETYFDEILYLIIVIPIFLLSWKALWRLRSLKLKDKNQLIVTFACLAYVLVLPRFKDYSYILLVLPTYYWFYKSKNLNASPFIFILLTFSTLHLTPPGLNILYTTLWNYYPFFILFVVWCLYLNDIYKMKMENHER